MSEIADYSPLWGKWHIKELLGKGSFGCVYRAEKTEFGNTYVSAVKHLKIPPEGTTKEMLVSEGLIASTSHFSQYCDRIRDDIIKEINTCYALRGNSNIVSYEDHEIIPSKDGIGYDIFIRMEYLVSLPKFMNYHVFTEEDVIRLGIEMCNALTILQKHQILHRDIKPANIFISSLGEFKLGDFGEAKMLSGTTVGMSVRGTYTYMAPEIFRGKPANITADLYSLGIVLYRLLNGNKAPFVPLDTVTTNSQTMESANIRRLSGEKIPVPNYCQNQELIRIIMRACEFDPKNRWQTPESMKEALLELKKRKALSKEQPVISDSDQRKKPQDDPAPPKKAPPVIQKQKNDPKISVKTPTPANAAETPRQNTKKVSLPPGTNSKKKFQTPVSNKCSSEIPKKSDRKSRKKLFSIHIGVLLLLGVELIGFTVWFVAKTMYVNYLYSDYLNQAVKETDKDKRVEYCRKAIITDSSKIDAYLALWGTFCYTGDTAYDYRSENDSDLAPYSFNPDESQEWEKTVFMNFFVYDYEPYHTQEYGDKLFYRVGNEIALGRSQSYKSAMRWLEKAKTYGSAETAQKAQTLYEMCRMKDILNTNNSDKKESFEEYKELWSVINEVMSFIDDIETSDEMYYCVHMLNIIGSCLDIEMMCMSSFADNDITSQQTKKFIQTLENELNKLKPYVSALDEKSELAQGYSNLQDVIKTLKEKYKEVYKVSY